MKKTTKIVTQMKKQLSPIILSRWAKKHPNLALFPFLIAIALLLLALGDILYNRTLGVETSRLKITKIESEKVPNIENLILEAEQAEIDMERNYILQDHDNQIDDQFKVNTELKEDVKFWFDLYTLHSKNEVLIYHKKKPHLVFATIKLSDSIKKLNQTSSFTQKNILNHISGQVDLIKARLKILSTKNEFSPLSSEEKSLLKAFGGQLTSDMHKEMLNAIDEVTFSFGLKEVFIQNITKRSDRFLTLEKIFSSHGLSPDLSRVFMIYNSYQNFYKQPNSIHLKTHLTRKYLKQWQHIDENKSLIKQARVFAKILKMNPNISWNKLFQFDSNLQAAFIAALHAEKYMNKFLPHVNLLKPSHIMAYKLNKSMQLNDLLKTTRYNKSEFLKLNEDITQSNIQLPKGYVFFIANRI